MNSWQTVYTYIQAVSSHRSNVKFSNFYRDFEYLAPLVGVKAILPIPDACFYVQLTN